MIMSAIGLCVLVSGSRVPIHYSSGASVHETSVRARLDPESSAVRRDQTLAHPEASARDAGRVGNVSDEVERRRCDTRARLDLANPPGKGIMTV